MADKNIISEALANINLVDIVSQDYALTRKGTDFVCQCPFHKESSPSFHVNNFRYHCFGCGQHGNAIDWMVNIKHLDFKEALEELGIMRKTQAQSQESGRLPHVDVESRILQCRARLPYKHLMKAIIYSKLGKITDLAFISVLPKQHGDEVELICKTYGLDHSDYFNQIEALHIWESIIKRWASSSSTALPADT